MRSYNHRYLKRLITQFPKIKVLVIGDLILDEFIWGSVSRISPEAPVPVVWVNSESFMPGGASNVSSNISEFGSQVYISGIVGEDQHGKNLKKMLTESGVNTSGIFTDTSRPTIVKSRIIAHNQQVVRIDREKLHPTDPKLIDKVVNFALKKIPEVDAILIEDYGKGLICPQLLEKIVSFAKSHNKIITVDPKDEHFDYYKGVTAITPNHHEAGRAVNVDITCKKSLKQAGFELLNSLNLDCVLVTLGENGMCLFDKNKTMAQIPTMAQEVYDVSGAGDTVISVFTLALALGAQYIDAAYLANHAAAIVVGKVGIAVATPDEIKKRLT